MLICCYLTSTGCDVDIAIMNRTAQAFTNSRRPEENASVVAENGRKITSKGHTNTFFVKKKKKVKT